MGGPRIRRANIKSIEMKITIDTTSKTIQIDQMVNLHDFLDEIMKILPNWKEYKLIPRPYDYNGLLGTQGGWKNPYDGINMPLGNPTIFGPAPNPHIFQHGGTSAGTTGIPINPPLGVSTSGKATLAKGGLLTSNTF